MAYSQDVMNGFSQFPQLNGFLPQKSNVAPGDMLGSLYSAYPGLSSKVGGLDSMRTSFANPGAPGGAAPGADAGYGGGFSMVGGGTGAPSPMQGAQSPQGVVSGPAGPTMGGGNPYLDQQAQGMVGQANRNFQTQTLPALRYGSMQAGGFGGSRQGVIEANATNDFNQGLNNSLANLYGTDWTNQQNRDLSRYGMDQNFYTQQRGQDQTGMALGADLYSKGMSGEWDPLKNASSVYSPYTGLGTTTATQQQGGGWQGALGGAISGGALGKQMGWW